MVTVQTSAALDLACSILLQTCTASLHACNVTKQICTINELTCMAVQHSCPGSGLGSLAGSLNPATGGIYTFTDDSNITLSAATHYFIVLTAATAIANGAYNWSATSTPSPGFNSYHWGGGQIPLLHSSNGSSWNSISVIYHQFAINATAVPEPGVLSLFGLGGLGFLWHRRPTKLLPRCPLF
jgi:hypothetical protein